MLFGQCPHGGGDKLKGASLSPSADYQGHDISTISCKSECSSKPILAESLVMELILKLCRMK